MNTHPQPPLMTPQKYPIEEKQHLDGMVTGNSRDPTACPIFYAKIFQNFPVRRL